MESLINTMTADDQLMVVLEDPNLDSTTFRASSKPLNNMVKFRQEMQMAQDVGKNKGVANAIKDYLNSKKLNFVCVAPSQRKQVTNKTCSLAPYTMPTKCSSEQFNSHTGYSGKTNEHGRDAAMLVWDMTSVKFNFFKQRQGKK